MRISLQAVILAGVVATSGAMASAAFVQIRVTVENLAPANSISFAPFRFGFSNGTFDAFDEGSTGFLLGQPSIADAPIVSVAEGGAGTTWFPAFAAAEPNANLGSVFGPGGPFLPGQTNSAVITVDTNNRYFTYGSMVVPSNDHFIGNDDPRELTLFDPAGNLILNSFTEKYSAIWDAGSETQNPLNAAFLVGGTNDNRVNENLPVRFDVAGLGAFNGLTTAAGYNFNSSLIRNPDTSILRVSFAVIPEPVSLVPLALGGLLAVRRRKA